MEKVCPKMWATSAIKESLPKANKPSPIGRKFAQSCQSKEKKDNVAFTQSHFDHLELATAHKSKERKFESCHDQKPQICQMAIKRLPSKYPPKFTQIVNFGFKISHLAALL
jgi:hypothetical protein